MFRPTRYGIGLALPALLACADAGVTGILDPPSPHLQQEAASLNAATRPLLGRLEGGAVAGDLCSLDPPGVMITATGEGLVSHLGRTTLLQTACVGLADFVPIGPSVATLTAANGDRLDGALTGLTGTADGFEMQVAITGGSGRFANASGAYTVEVVQSEPLQPFVATIHGWVRY